ncbi:MAG TPA: PfkB family carbohydrate kinase [Terriglobales bacterium]|nr:PfkB family carbohydrate kinase [Terriglobales bacterium]
MKYILGIGTSVVDILARAPRAAVGNEMVPFADYSKQGGGMVATAVIAAARLGAPCKIISPVGDDAMGEFCRQDYLRHGIEVSHVLTQPGRETPWSMCIADDATKNRAIYSYMENAPFLSLSELDDDMVANAGFVHLYERRLTWQPVVMRVAHLCREHGAKLSVDAFTYDPFYDELIGVSDIWITSEDYYRQKYGDTPLREGLADLKGMGPEVVITTLGDRGLAGIDGEGYFELPAFSVAVQDTTGAGDVFHGAYLAMLSRGMDARRAAFYASGAAAVKCTRIGGRAALPDFETLDAFVKTGVIDYCELDRRVEFYRKV